MWAGNIFLREGRGRRNVGISTPTKQTSTRFDNCVKVKNKSRKTFARIFSHSSPYLLLSFQSAISREIAIECKGWMNFIVKSRIIGSIPGPLREFLPPINYNFRPTTPEAHVRNGKPENFVTLVVHASCR